MGLTCWSYPRPAKSAGMGCNWSKGRWVNPGLTNDRQTRMHPRHGTNHCVPAGAGVKHAMRICAASEGANVGQLQVGLNRSLRAVLCLTLSLTQLIMAQTVMRKKVKSAATDLTRCVQCRSACLQLGYTVKHETDQNKYTWDKNGALVLFDPQYCSTALVILYSGEFCLELFI